LEVVDDLDCSLILRLISPERPSSEVLGPAMTVISKIGDTKMYPDFPKASSTLKD